MDLTFDTLMVRAQDEPDAVYGLVAEKAVVSEDRTHVTFHMRKDARWHDGTPLTAKDVVFTFNTLKEKGDPRFAIILRDVIRAEAVDAHTVRFDFNPDGSLRDLPMIVADLPILSKAYYSENEFSRPSLKKPLGSGPYRIGEIKAGRSITYERVMDYWGADLPVNKGRFNFDRITIEYFRDRSIGLEAFLAGEYDVREEFTSKMWANGYTGPAVEAGLIKRGVLPDDRPSGAQAWFLNLRRAKFQDRRVRMALDLAFDFEWTNKALFHGAYERTNGLYVNSPLAPEGPPEGRELALLEPFRDDLPEAVFGPPYEPPETDASGMPRENLRKAVRLLREAGWRLSGGVLRHRLSDQPFEIEFLTFQPITNRILLPYIKNLARLGIRGQIRMVDSSQYQRRLEEFDFDITTRRLVMPLTPGTEQRNLWTSRAAETIGSLNIGGIADPAVDAMVEAIIEADSRDGLEAAVGALDRILMHERYIIPQWYKGTHTLAWWDKFSWPAVKPRFARGVMDTWWEDADKADRIEQRQPADTPSGESAE